MLLMEAAFITAVLLLSGTPVVESGLVFEGPGTFQALGGRPCSVECRVRSTTPLKYPPEVVWYQDRAFTQLNESLSEYVPVHSPYWQSRQYYPSTNCVQQAGSAIRYNCDLNFRYCSMGYFGRYRCDVTNKETGKTISKFLQLRTISPDPGPKPRCYMPRAVNLSVVPHYLENGSLTATLYWNYTQKPDRQEYCDGSRQWTVGYKTFDNVWGIPSDFGRVSSLTVSTATAARRDTHYEFTGITRSKYYIFQVHNEADDPTDQRSQDFTSMVYYFGEQVPPRVTTQDPTVRLTVGETYTIRCTAVGIPRPTIQISKANINFQFRYFEEEDDSVSSELVLHDVRRSDSGLYQCIALNTLVNPPAGKRHVSDIIFITVTVEGPDTIHCISYTGSVCSPFIENIKFYVNDSQRDILDDWAMAAFIEIEQLEGSVTTNPEYSKCVAFTQAIVCHSLYPYCDPSSDSPSARSVCLEACNILTTGVCRDVFDALPSNVTSLLVSGCDTVAREGGESPECIHVSLESPQKNEHDIIPTTGSCSRGNGWGYRGQVDITEFGTPCQAWSSQTPHRHPRLPAHEILGAGHACRNPWGLSRQPWCYTAVSNTRWEYCNVPSCDVCERYSGSFCRSVAGFNTSLVYINKTKTTEGQVEVERRMLSLFHWHQLELSPGCSNALRQFICHSALPFCSASGAPVPKHLCGEYCHLLDDLQFCPSGIRQNIYQELNSSNLILQSPHCTPSGTNDCLPPPARLQVDRNLQPTTNCYRSRDAGQSYQGNVAVTRDGVLCQAWSSNLVHQHHIKASIFPELANAENYCRNPGRLGTSPWCYTLNSSVVWDYCLIPVCNEPTNNSMVSTNPPTSLEGTIIGACIGFSLFIILLVALGVGIMVYCNRRIAKRIPPRDQPITLDRLQLHHGGSGSGSTSSGSSELKVSYTYNPQYMIHSTIPPNLIPIVNTFKQIDKSKIAYLKQLGQGNFGVVFQGKLIEGEEETMVAVKTLKEETALESFVHEAKLMFSYDHPNIIKIYGVCILDLPYYMVVEFMDKGDLAQFLRESGSSFHQRLLNPFGTRSRTESTLSNSPASLSTSQLVDICKQISGGMEYLAEKNHVHRDLACRNCLVKSGSEGLIVKICDFGMSHNLYAQDYYRVKGQAVLPVRWMSPEAVVYGKFSTAGDVWSFGVVMWEVFSFAMQPYFGVSNEQVTDFIRRGRTLSRPVDCPHKIYEIMKDCWNMTPSGRPSFSELHSMLNECHESISSGDDRSSSSPDQISQMDSELDSDAFYEENSSIDGGDD